MKNHIEALIANGLFAFFGFVSFVILSRNCSPSLFGEWVLFLSLATFFDLIRYGFTRNAVVRLVAATENHHISHKINASGLHLGIIILLITTALFYVVLLFFRGYISDIYLMFLTFYPLVGLSNILWNNAQSWLQAKLRFRDIIWLRISNMGVFVLTIIVLKFTDNLTFNNILLCYILSNITSSLFSLLKGWDSAMYIAHWSDKQIKEIASFGRYSMFASLGSNLLKSADTFIISLSPILGVTGVAVFAIPFKVIEMLELPIRSIAMVGYNHFSKTVIRGNLIDLKRMLARYLLIMFGATTPLILIIALFPTTILEILGGKNYTEYMGTMVTMSYILLAYGFLLIPDRITGVTLEALNMPNKNMYKVLVMAGFKIVGDIVAVFVFESLIAVVFVTVLYVIFGIIFGFYFIPRGIHPRIKDFKFEFQSLTTRVWQMLSSKRIKSQ